jgi:hypothetical protein
MSRAATTTVNEMNIPYKLIVKDDKKLIMETKEVNWKYNGIRINLDGNEIIMTRKIADDLAKQLTAIVGAVPISTVAPVKAAAAKTTTKKKKSTNSDEDASD